MSVFSPEGRRDSALLHRLGSGLALVFHDTFHAPLPDKLQGLADRLGGERSGQRPDEDAVTDLSRRPARR